jgi:hypothetical protein
VRDRLDGADAVLTRDVHGDRQPVTVHAVHKWHLSIGERCDDMRRVHWGKLLSRGRVSGAAMPCWELLERSWAWLRGQLHGVPRGLVVWHWLDAADGVLGWYVHDAGGRVSVLSLPWRHVPERDGRHILPRVHGRELLPGGCGGCVPMSGNNILEQH